MRAALICLLGGTLLGACTPEIVSGAYTCGPEEACPADQACDGPTGICVTASRAQPFTCGDVSELEPNNTQATAESVGTLNCASYVVEVFGCQAIENVADDWFSVAVPEVCGANERVELRLSYAISFGALALELHDESGATVGTAAPCSAPSDDDVSVALCLIAPVTPGKTYAARVSGAGLDDCAGACAYNRYRLTLQLASS